MRGSPLLSTISMADPSFPFTNDILGYSTNVVDIESESGYKDYSAPLKDDSIFTLRFYRRYFNVETHEIISRLRFSAYPWREDYYYYNFWRAFAREAQSPDFYAAVWMPLTWTTLLYVATLLSMLYKHRSELEKLPLHTHSLPACFLFCNLSCSGVYTGVWGLCRYAKLNQASFTEIISLTSYGMIPFLIGSILCVAPITALQWLFLIVPGFISSRFLMQHLKSEIASTTSLGLKTSANLENISNTKQISRLLTFAFILIFVSVGIIEKFWFF